MAKQSTGTELASRREAILADAAKLFAQRGFAATTMRDIADATGVLAGSLYHHFESKDAIVDAILSRSLSALLERYRAVQREGGDASKQFDALVRASFAAIADDADASLIYLRDRALLLQIPRLAYLEATRAQVDDIWLSCLRAGQEQGAFRRDVDVQRFYNYAATALWWSAGWQSAETVGDGTAADAFLAIFRQGLDRRQPAPTRAGTSTARSGR